MALQSFALEISIDSAKDNFTKYSILHITSKENFVCQEIKDDFSVTKEIVCAFSKKPLKDIESLQNNFFQVKSFQKKDTYFISIKPFHRMKLYAEIFNLIEDDTLFSADISIANRWSIIGYKENLPLIKSEEKSALAINFPFYLDKEKFPYVGSLDLRGNPVHIKKVEDVTEYLKVKKYFATKRYDDALDIINDILSSYPNTLFKSELIYYQIKIYNKIKAYENVINNAKDFLREYSSDENIPEILSLMAKAYVQIGKNADADYFFDRLFSEHKGDVFAEWGYIYKGEMLEASSGNTQAIKYYKKALYETKDLEVAVTAAYHLTEIFMAHAPKKAVKYARKIIAAKPDYFMQDLKKSQKIMNGLAKSEEYKVAASIAEAMLQSMGPTYDEYEELLRRRALWLAKTKDKKRAIEALNDYMKKFPDQSYIDAIQTAKDRLFFDDNDTNTSRKLAGYDKLMRKYAGDDIAQRALYEKAKLLLKEKNYESVLDLKDSLEELQEKYIDVEDIIREAATGLMKVSLKQQNCKNILVIANDYNITLLDSWDDGIYACAMKGGDFQLSKSIASKNLNFKNIDLRKKWLYRYIKIDFEIGNYNEAVDAAKDLITLIDNIKESPYKEIYRYLFDAYNRLGEKENMIDAMAKIEEVFGFDYKDIDRYVVMVGLGNELKDDSMGIKYALKVIDIQNRSQTHAQTPYIEFTLYSAYMNKNEFNKAYKTLVSLNGANLTKKQRARQKYLLGMILNKLQRDKDATKAYNEAIEADPNSAWAKLAKSALEIYNSKQSLTP